MNRMMTRNSNPTRKQPSLPPRRAKPQTVHIEFSDSVAESVAIAGTFNDWRPEATPMVAVGEGRWVKGLILPPGSYEYCLVVDGGKWLPDPQASEMVPNPFGGRNSVLKVAKSS
jgi:1,4-alpha-glucan branching enzyme